MRDIFNSYQIALSSASSVAAGSTFSQKLSLGHTYEKVHLVYSNMTLADLTDLKIKLNGKPMQEYSVATSVNRWNGYFSLETHSGILTLNFAQPHWLPSGNRFTGLGAAEGGGVETLEITGKIASSVTNPTIEFFATVSAPTRLGDFITHYEYGGNATATGDLEIKDIPKGNGDILAIGVAHSSILGMKIRRDRLTLFEGSKAMYEAAQKEARPTKRTPQNGFYVYDPLLTGDFRDKLVINGASDFSVIPDFGATGAWTAQVLTLTNLSRF